MMTSPAAPSGCWDMNSTAGCRRFGTLYVMVEAAVLITTLKKEVTRDS
jgi:hypothetical protein